MVYDKNSDAFFPQPPFTAGAADLQESFDSSQHSGSRRQSSSSSKARTYSCTMCDKEFATQWGLTKHNATHTGNYKLTCDLCGKGFMEQRMMKTHMDGHRKKMIQNHLL